MQDVPTSDEITELIEQRPQGPDIFSLLFKSAQSGHGRQLQPSQVGEIVQTMMAMDAQGRQLAGKIEALTRIVYCMLVSRDPVLIQVNDDDEEGVLVVPDFVMSEEFYEQQDYERGFTLDWDEDTGTITVALGEAAEEDGEALGVSDVLGDELAAEDDLGDIAPVPEATEDEEAVAEPSGDEAVGSLDSEDESGAE